MNSQRKNLIIIIAVLIFAAIIIYGYYFNWGIKIGSATLSWNANTESDLAGYKIYYGSSPRTGDCPPGGYPQNIDVVGKEISYNISNLSIGKTYYFSITSYDVSGNESCFSPEMSKLITE